MFQRQRTDDQADDKGANCVDADHQTGGARLAELLGDRHRSDLGGCKDCADKDQRQRDDLHRP
jgi:hypothetical protein